MTNEQILSEISKELYNNSFDADFDMARVMVKLLTMIVNELSSNENGGGQGNAVIIQNANGTYLTRPESGAVTWIGDTYPTAYQQGDTIQYTAPAIDFTLAYDSNVITVTCDVLSLTRQGFTGTETWQAQNERLFTYTLLSNDNTVLETISNSPLSIVSFAFAAQPATTYKVQVRVFDSYIAPIRFTENTILTENPVVELLPTGFNMVDNNSDGRADNIIRSWDSTGNTTYLVASDGANGWVGGYQRVSATTATNDTHFMAIKMQSSYNASEGFKPNTSYHVVLRYRATAQIRIEGAGGINPQSITNNTAGTVSSLRLILPPATGDFVTVEFDWLSNLTDTSNSNVLQIGFNPSVASPELYEWQMSIVEN